MSETGHWSALRQRVGGKWQIPLLLAACAMLGGSLVRYRRQATDLSPTQAIELLTTLSQDGSHARALELARNTLQRPEVGDSQRALIQLHIARAESSLAEVKGQVSKAAGRRIVDAYGFASRHELPFTAADFTNIARAYEGQSEYANAVSYYEKAIGLGVPSASEVRRYIWQLRRFRLQAPPPALIAELDAILVQLEPHELDVRMWAIEQKMNLLEQQDRLSEVHAMLLEEAPRFEESELRKRFEFLQALVLYKTGRFDEAERFLRSLRNGLDVLDDVHAMSGWLLGRVILEDGGATQAEEAHSFFADVIDYHPGSAYAVASRIGLAEAFALLDRHPEAIAAYRDALADLERARGADLVDVDVLRTSLSIMAEAMRVRGDAAAALSYAELMIKLVDRRQEDLTIALWHQLAQLQKKRGLELSESGVAASPGHSSSDVDPIVVAGTDVSRKLFAQAADAFQDLARLTHLQSERSAEFEWEAAELSAQAGQWNRAVGLYRRFAEENPRHALTPRSLLRRGQLNQARGELAAAVETYQECFRRFPRTIEGTHSLIPMAECHLAMGPGQEDAVERTLRLILDDSEVFTPQAPEFADALFLLGEVENRRGAFERAVTTLEEVVQRFPDDPRLPRALFLLADSYRLSALAVQRDLGKVEIQGEREELQRQLEARLRRARELYQSLITTYEARGSDGLNSLERVYLRLSYLYVADCHFEMRDFATALKLYEAAAAAYADTTSALAAYVQIINCHVFLGEKGEARAALSRAVILTDVLPDAALRHGVSPESRDDWRNYFKWLEQSEIL